MSYSPAFFVRFTGDKSTYPDLSGNGNDVAMAGDYDPTTSPLGANSAIVADALTTVGTVSNASGIYTPDTTWMMLIRRDGGAEGSPSYVMSVDGDTTTAFRANGGTAINKFFVKRSTLMTMTIPVFETTDVWYWVIGRFWTSGGTDYGIASNYYASALDNGSQETDTAEARETGTDLLLLNNIPTTVTFDGAVAAAIILPSKLSDAQVSEICALSGV